MTIKQKVKKALPLCFGDDCDYPCGKCPYVRTAADIVDDNIDCVGELVSDAIQVITDLEAKNKKLSKQVKDLKGTIIILEDLLKCKE